MQARLRQQTFGPIDSVALDVISRKLESGDYASAEDVISAGLALLDCHPGGLKTLGELLGEGVDSGDAVDFDFETFLAEMDGVIKKRERSDSEID